MSGDRALLRSLLLGGHRTASRVAAVQALFQSEQAGDSPETVIDQFIRHRLGEPPSGAGFEDGRIPDAEVPLFSRIVRATIRQQETIDAMLAQALPADWPINRLDPVLRALLRADRQCAARQRASLLADGGWPDAGHCVQVRLVGRARGRAPARG